VTLLKGTKMGKSLKSPYPVISIVGRPNVGKSSLFNRIIGYRKAITEDSPGVTRDRNYGEFDLFGRKLLLIDTGGFQSSPEDLLSPLVMRQIDTSVEESSVILFVLDGKDGLLPGDVEIAATLRRNGKPVLFVVNKIDSLKRESEMVDFHRLGVETFYGVSATHGLGVGELLDGILEVLEAQGEEGPDATAQGEDEGLRDGTEAAEERLAKIAIVGKPNTGKSSIMNRILGAERMIVSDIPGTTRDAIDSRITFQGRDILLIDTAGLRRKSRISRKVEEYSVSSALRSIERADVVNLVIDASEGVTHQDAAIAYTVTERGRGLCIVINKWDLTQGAVTEKQYREGVLEKVPHASYCPVVFVSARTGKNIEKILREDARISLEREKRIETPKLNRVLKELTARHSLSHVHGKEPKIYYIHQVQASPPTFLLFSNFPELVPEHYRRYLENALREKYGFAGTPIRLIFKKK
jgi:GTP-binding protein